MYLKRCGRTKAKKDDVYWALVESYRTRRGPRQRVVAYLGEIAQSTARGIKQVATHKEGSWHPDRVAGHPRDGRRGAPP